MEWVSWWISGRGAFKEEKTKSTKARKWRKESSFFFFFPRRGTLTSYSTGSVGGSRGSLESSQKEGRSDGGLDWGGRWE